MGTKGHFQQGSVEGTGAAINVQLGFVPDYVVLHNIDGSARGEWQRGMGAGDMFKHAGATASWATSGGIDVYEGTLGADSAGFTIGADADLNASGETILYAAWGQE